MVDRSVDEKDGTPHGGMSYDSSALSRLGLRFKDPTHERLFIELEFLPVLRYRAPRVGACVLATSCVALIDACLAYRTAAHGLNLGVAVAQCLLWLALVLAFALPERLGRPHAPRWVAHALYIATQVAHGAYAFAPSGTPFYWFCELHPLLALFSMVLAGICLPFEPLVTLAGVVGMVAAMAVVAETARASPSAWSASDRRAYVGAEFAIVGTLVVLTRWYLHTTQRRLFYCGAEHARVLDARERAEATHTETLAKRNAEVVEAALAGATAARSRLIRVFMHDIRSPLLVASNAAAEYDELLADMECGDVAGAVQAARTTTAVLQLACAKLEKITADMLDFESYETAAVELDVAPFTLGDLAADVLAACRSAAQAQRVELRVGALDEATSSLAVLGDLPLLVQAVESAVLNALEASQPSQVVTVGIALADALANTKLSAQRSGSLTGWVAPSVVVRDEGTGLLPDQLARLNGDVAETVFSAVSDGQLGGKGGTGLALARARHVLKLHADSRMHVSSDGPGRGTTVCFTLHLKLADVASARNDSRRAADEPATGDADGGEAGASEAALLVRWNDSSSSRSHSASAPSRRRGSLARSQVFGSCSFGYQGPTAPRVAPHPPDGDEEAREALSDTDAPRALAPALSPCTQARVPAHVERPALGGRDAAAKPRFPAGFCVLYAEDDAVLRRSLTLRVFKPLGIAVEEAVDGAAAVRAFDAAQRARGADAFALVLLDNQMPFKTGVETATELRQRGFVGKIIGFTGDPVGCDDRKAFEGVVDVCFNKDSAGVKALSQLLLTFALPASPADGGRPPPAPLAPPARQPPPAASTSAPAAAPPPDAAAAAAAPPPTRAAASQGLAEDYAHAMAAKPAAEPKPWFLVPVPRGDGPPRPWVGGTCRRSSATDYSYSYSQRGARNHVSADIV